ncbi:MAG TPA: hypothetical protein PK772_02735 [Chitinophagaceae bacterium]|nr:hypothetical protein [Chitinophagaceae bacterium]
MGLIKEPKEVDFTLESKPWTVKELAEFRKLMQSIKLKRTNKNATKIESKVTTMQQKRISLH